MTKKLLIICIILAVAGVAAFFVLNRSSKHNLVAPIATSSSPISAPASAKPASSFHWGATVRAYNLSNFDVAGAKAAMAEQLDLAKQIGITDVRTNLEQNTEINDNFVNLALARGLNPVLVLEPNYSQPGFTRNDAYTYAYQAAARYKGKVKDYQLANEASGATIIPTHGGNKPSDYDESKYQSFKAILLGLSEGVHDADSNAMRIVSSNWIGTAVIDRLIADGVNFEIIGWNWYSDMGNDLIVKADGSDLNIPEYFKKYNKQFWVVELNRAGGTQDGKVQEQASFLQTFITNVTSHHNIQGIFIYLLTDQCGELNTAVGHMGLVELVRNNPGCSLGAAKPALSTYQNLIQNTGN